MFARFHSRELSPFSSCIFLLFNFKQCGTFFSLQTTSTICIKHVKHCVLLNYKCDIRLYLAACW